MRQIVYAMRFTGQATPVGPTATSYAPVPPRWSTSITSRVDSDGLIGTLEALPGGEASLALEVTFTSESDFLETGAISFGDGHLLRFSTIGSGYLGPSADPTRKHGTVMWKVDEGEGVSLARAV